MIPLQWVTATWFMFVCMIMGAPVPIVLIAGALAYLLSPRYKTATPESTKMTPEQKRIEELERQLAKQNDTLEAIVNAVVCLHGDVQISEAYRDQYIGKMLEKLDDMKENTL